MTVRLLALLAMPLLLTACASKIDPIAWEAEQLTLYSIDGDAVFKQPPPDAGAKTGETFHDYPVLGKVDITDPADRKALLASLDKGIKGNDGMVAACFIPRHGLRATRGKDTIDYVICFECLQIYIYKNGAKSSELTTAAPSATFNAMLTKANVPLAQSR